MALYWPNYQHFNPRPPDCWQLRIYSVQYTRHRHLLSTYLLAYLSTFQPVTAGSLAVPDIQHPVYPTQIL
nr:MAG TPA: hypothetical protein [Caudoviricetes sp.]